MKTYICIASIVTMTLLANSASMAQTTDKGYRPKAGMIHPDFALPNIQDGNEIRLSSFRGKKVLLLHFASW